RPAMAGRAVSIRGAGCRWPRPLTTERASRPLRQRAVWKKPVLSSCRFPPGARDRAALIDGKPFPVGFSTVVERFCGIGMVTAYPEHAALEAWSSVLTRAREELPETTLVMWFSDVRPTDLSEDVLTLAVPSPLVRERLQHHHLALIEEAVASAYGGPV